jgi:hypothetical protein
VELGRLQDGLETVVGRLLWTDDDVGIEAGLCLLPYLGILRAWLV